MTLEKCFLVFKKSQSKDYFITVLIIINMTYYFFTINILLIKLTY